MSCCGAAGTNTTYRIILFSPFIPFIVLFCYVIEGASGTEDVELIERFMTSMEPWRGLSGQTDKLFQLCRVLNDLARVCVEAKRQAVNISSSQSHTQTPKESNGWKGDKTERVAGMAATTPASLFVENNAASNLRGNGFLRQQQLQQHHPNDDLMMDESDADLSMAVINPEESWNWGPAPFMAASQAHQVGDLFTEYMGFMNVPEFIAPEWLRRDPSSHHAPGSSGLL